MEIKSHAPIIICEKSLFVIQRPRIPLLAAPSDAGTRLFSSIQLRVIFTATIWGTEPVSGKLIVTSSAF